MNEIKNRIRLLDKAANIDINYGPYNSVADANNQLPTSIRKPGLTVGIYTDSNQQIVKEYWYNNGIDNNDLVPKDSYLQDVINKGFSSTSPNYIFAEFPSGVQLEDDLSGVYFRKNNSEFLIGSDGEISMNSNRLRFQNSNFTDEGKILRVGSTGGFELQDFPFDGDYNSLNNLPTLQDIVDESVSQIGFLFTTFPSGVKLEDDGGQFNIFNTEGGTSFNIEGFSGGKMIIRAPELKIQDSLPQDENKFLKVDSNGFIQLDYLNNITEIPNRNYYDLQNLPSNLSDFINDVNFITDYNVTENDVIQYESSLNITESQITDLQSYLTDSFKNIANSSGVNQFTANGEDTLRFEGSGDASVSFNSATKTITISSTPGSGTGGTVTSFNGRDGAVVSVLGDYNTDLVTEATNLYFTNLRAVTAIQNDSSWNATNWNTAYNWGDHSQEGYLTSFTETDPTVASYIKAITNQNISNWNNAYSWGNHANAGYITGYSVTQADVTQHESAITITESQISNFGTYDNYNYFGVYTDDQNSANINSQDILRIYGTDGLSTTLDVASKTLTISGSGFATETWVSNNFDDYQSWRYAIDGSPVGNIGSNQELNFKSGSNVNITDDVGSILIDAINTTYTNGSGLNLTGTTFSVTNTIQENAQLGATAHGWGNHSEQGYLTDYTVTQNDVTQYESNLEINYNQLTGAVVKNYVDTETSYTVEDNDYIIYGDAALVDLSIPSAQEIDKRILRLVLGRGFVVQDFVVISPSGMTLFDNTTGNDTIESSTNGEPVLLMQYKSSESAWIKIN